MLTLLWFEIFRVGLGQIVFKFKLGPAYSHVNKGFMLQAGPTNYNLHAYCVVGL